ncbi:MULTISPECIES: histidinol-phosphate transaminase [unclassified Staphylococcus]|uniref:pyridoxal phosphate-dependent aminotransferase n=1 Tax=unclassified Staphylococcus TaxID=91994 RepID=UPI0021D2020F|nr:MULTISPECIES: histidinol-phosphate transaminase [unclassified Staphylococcus]UXR78227.1 histidinol-phosphate aminotransferase family protein [Staphylococcus sp. IVB6227]UXR82391.1 histidinol-phosphate aminotransferase family protein [Staphylococcus sp. IVB6214]
MIKMDKNESPMTPLSPEIYFDILNNQDYNLYHDDDYDRFRTAYANYFGGFSKEQVCAANGSDELIQKLMFIMPEGPCLTLNPDFFMYQSFAEQVGRPIEFVDATTDLQFPIEAVLTRIDEVKPSFFILSNPHNPTGQRFDETYLLQIADKMKMLGGYLVIDEAYIDFSTPLDITLEDHIVVMHTLSKAFGLAGLRIGVLVGTETTLDLVRQIEQPYPLNILSLRIATYLFEHPDSTKKFVAKQRALSERLKDIFKRYVDEKLVLYPSETNFILTAGTQAVALGEYVKSHGFQPRFYNPITEQQMSDCVRYSIVSDEDMDRFETIVKEWSEQHDLSN